MNALAPETDGEQPPTNPNAAEPEAFADEHGVDTVVARRIVIASDHAVTGVHPTTAGRPLAE